MTAITGPVRDLALTRGRAGAGDELAGLMLEIEQAAAVWQAHLADLVAEMSGVVWYHFDGPDAEEIKVECQQSHPHLFTVQALRELSAKLADVRGAL